MSGVTPVFCQTLQLIKRTDGCFEGLRSWSGFTAALTSSGALRTAHVGTLGSLHTWTTVWIKRNVRKVYTPCYNKQQQTYQLAVLSMVITHLRMALSSATSATVVAPFTTNRPSVAPIADLLREGRGKAKDHRVVDRVNCQHVHPIWHNVHKRS